MITVLRCVGMAALVAAVPSAFSQQVFTVDAFHDADAASPGDGICADATGHCTLRAAISEANADPDQPAVIVLSAGTYTLSIDGTGEDSNATGDLDFTSEITIVGDVPAFTVIDADGIDRVFDVHEGAEANFEQLTIRGGRVNGRGAGIRVLGATASITDVYMIDNRTLGNLAEGGAIYVSGEGNHVVVTDSRLIDNEAMWGGAISNNGATQTTIEVRGSTLAGNVARSSGGAIDSKGIATSDNFFLIEHSTLSGNVAAGTHGSGGAIFTNGRVLHIVNSTISGNEAVYGGGLAITGRTVHLEHATITENYASQQGGGFMRTGGTTTVRNTIVAGNDAHTLPQAGPDIHNPETAAANVVLHGYNIIGNSAGFWYTAGSDGATNQIDVDPLLDELADNGGPTLTHALLEDSPGIDAGNCLMLDGQTETELDQRFFPRTGEACDIGAFEFHAEPPVSTNGGPDGAEVAVGLVFPNPSRTAAALPVHLDAGLHVRAEVFDLLGRRVAIIASGLLAPGDHLLHIDTLALPTGLYLVRVEAGGAPFVRRLTVVR